VFGTGYMISSRRVKLLPSELQAFYFLRTNGVDITQRKLHRLLGQKKAENGTSAEDERPAIAQEMAVDDFKNPLPLVISDKVNGVQTETRALLLLDGQPRGEDSISPEKPRYRLLYVPIPEDVGSHRLDVKLQGSSDSLVSIDLLLKGRSPEVSESIAKVK
jgi:hypothetical protein